MNVGAAFYYHGIWRMDWGLGNPNRTAALIATLMVGSWALAFWRSKLFPAALLIFTVLGLCLSQTLSRGGMIATIVGTSILLIFSRRPWPKSRVLLCLCSAVIIIGHTIYLRGLERYTRPPIRDASVVHRWEVWRSVPRMVVDAPGGWGFRNAGEAYQNWYQPLDRGDPYPHLISSHLTWLAELSWPGRYVYVFLWIIVLLICFPPRDPTLRWFAVPFGIWASFAVASSFSTVANSGWLWVLPFLSLAAVQYARSRNRMNLRWRSYGIAGMTAAAITLLALIAGYASPRSVIAKGARDYVIVGDNPPQHWVLVNTATIGHYGRAFRSYLHDHPGETPSLGFTEKLSAIPKDFSGTIVACRDAKPDELKAFTSAKFALINPTFSPDEAASIKDRIIKVAVGEFSQSPSASVWLQTKSAERLDGVGDFVQNWPELIFGAKRESTSKDAVQAATTNASALSADSSTSIHPETIDLAKFRERVEARDSLIFDARPEIFHRLGHVPGALSLPREDFQAAYDKLRKRMESKKDGRIIVYCSDSGCEDSEMVASALVKLGYSNVLVFKGGWAEWTQAHLPEERSP